MRAGCGCGATRRERTSWATVWSAAVAVWSAARNGVSGYQLLGQSAGWRAMRVGMVIAVVIGRDGWDGWGGTEAPA